MDNRFSIAKLAPTWVRASEILKGDLPGHPFRGNQYATYTASELADAVTGRATLADAFSNGDTIDKEAAKETETSLRDQAQRHEEIAAEHRATISDLKSLISLHEEAAQAHERAKDKADYAAGMVSGYTTPTETFGSEQKAADFAMDDIDTSMPLQGSIEEAREASDASEAANRAPYKSLQVSTE